MTLLIGLFLVLVLGVFFLFVFIIKKQQWHYEKRMLTLQMRKEAMASKLSKPVPQYSSSEQISAQLSRLKKQVNWLIEYQRHATE